MVGGGGWDFFGRCVLKKQSERETGACRAKGVGWVHEGERERVLQLEAGIELIPN